MLLICYPKCTTCAKAERWLRENEIAYEYRDIKQQNPNKEELAEWHCKSGLPLKRFFNTSGQLYRQQNVKDQLPGMSEEQQLELLATDGMMVKRPILLWKGGVLLGFSVKEWENALLAD